MNARMYTGNTAKTVNLCFLLIGFLMVILPFLLQADMMQWGFGIAFIGFFLFLTTLILVPFFGKRAAIMKKIHRGEGILAWWNYPPEIWEKQRQEAISDLVGMKIGGFVLGGIFALIGIVILATDPDDMGAFLAIMLVIGVFFILLSQIAARSTRKNLLNTIDEAIIHEQGLFYRGTLTSWGNGMNRLKAVGFNMRNPSQMLFCYRHFQRRGDRRAVEVIPIPPGQEGVAANIVSWFNRPMDRDWQDYFDRTSVEEE